MTVALTMIARDEADHIGAALSSVRGLVDAWVLVDTGSTDGTQRIATEAMQGVPGKVVQREWLGFADARTAALKAAWGAADWLLVMDADMTAEAHPRFREWLDTDPDPWTMAWQVEIYDRGLRYRLPWLLRGDRDWRYEGETHAYLVGEGKQRPVTGLTLTHHGEYSREKFERDLEVLASGVESKDARSVYYTAWALKALGRTAEAIEMFELRAQLNGWDEERWHSSYMAALLAEDVDALVAVHAARPWRHEPLSQAAKLVAARGARDDMLFLEDRG